MRSFFDYFTLYEKDNGLLQLYITALGRWYLINFEVFVPCSPDNSCTQHIQIIWSRLYNITCKVNNLVILPNIFIDFYTHVRNRIFLVIYSDPSLLKCMLPLRTIYHNQFIYVHSRLSHHKKSISQKFTIALY